MFSVAMLPPFCLHYGGTDGRHQESPGTAGKAHVPRLALLPASSSLGSDVSLVESPLGVTLTSMPRPAQIFLKALTECEQSSISRRRRPAARFLWVTAGLSESLEDFALHA
jgi:hypothetical protein